MHTLAHFVYVGDVSRAYHVVPETVEIDDSGEPHVPQHGGEDQVSPVARVRKP